ncbi:MAG: serine protease [Caulobacteraceae bacterium]|nr:serine protease [Caulobacteraceae bacterium]
MEPDLTIELINATVQVEGPMADGRRAVGTGFLVEAPTPDGRPRTVLVTAGHLLDQMTGDQARVGWRFSDGDGAWRFAPQPLVIRDAAGQPQWLRHPAFDVAVIRVTAPPEFTRAAIPLAWLADEHSFEEWGVGPGDEMMTIGYPMGLSSNSAGFPIVRTGRVASYPLYPTALFPTFLVDLRVLGGNSGGPVFMTGYNRRRPGTEQGARAFVAGVLTKQLCSEIGVVTHAYYVREAIRMMDDPGLSRSLPGPMARDEDPPKPAPVAAC